MNSKDRYHIRYYMNSEQPYYMNSEQPYYMNSEQHATYLTSLQKAPS